jgi:hypothetical protein
VEVPDPPVFAVESAQYLRHGQQQLSIGELRAAAPARAGLHNMIVDEHTEFGQEGFQVFGHALILETLRPETTQRHTFKESTIQ